MQPEISRRENLRLQALEARFEAMLAVGRQGEAVAELQGRASQAVVSIGLALRKERERN